MKRRQKKKASFHIKNGGFHHHVIPFFFPLNHSFSVHFYPLKLKRHSDRNHQDFSIPINFNQNPQKQQIPIKNHLHHLIIQSKIGG